MNLWYWGYCVNYGGCSIWESAITCILGLIAQVQGEIYTELLEKYEPFLKQGIIHSFNARLRKDMVTRILLGLHWQLEFSDWRYQVKYFGVWIWYCFLLCFCCRHFAAVHSCRMSLLVMVLVAKGSISDAGTHIGVLCGALCGWGVLLQSTERNIYLCCPISGCGPCRFYPAMVSCTLWRLCGMC